MSKKYISSFGEEVGNAVSHGVMSAITLLALPVAAIYSFARTASLTTAVGVSIFGVSIFLMFMASTLYHSMSPTSRHKQVFQILDHIFIYVAIAGTYTPVALVTIGGWQGIVIVALQWAMVIFGVLYKSLASRSIPALSLTIYLVMGWTVIFFFPIFLSNASITFIVLIASGGLCYTIGAVFYAMKGFKYHHMVWHLLIDAAAACHYVAIMWFL